MVTTYWLTPYILFFPLLGFLINGLFGRKFKNENLIGWIATSAVAISFLIAVAIFLEMISLPEEEKSKIVDLFNWISVGSFKVDFSLQVDQLSILMTMIVTGVGSLIHMYAIGYMHGDSGFWRFFAYLNLFIFAMLVLVLADNFLLMFLGWEGVGVCSYLLIGFWYYRKFENGTTGDAAKKAFIVNRIGDFGFLLAIFFIVSKFGTLNFQNVFAQSSLLTSGDAIITTITLLLFLGATGKSAQIPLYVWLPDAMAGPTPVSALIHAATMVTAGVYMVARCSILFALAPTTLAVVAVIGILTALVAGSIGLVQNDIKKVLAYSTVSQLGYMFVAMGVGAFSVGIFHLMTHAFFKALLFLGAGSVIHAMHHEQNIQNMGGLKKYLPITYKTFFIAALAISGVPFFSGFFSKDEILWKAFSNGSFTLWLMGIIGAAMTAFYMFRLVTLTFEGKSRFDEHKFHPHESPKVMTTPLIILAILSAVGGFVAIPHALDIFHFGNKFDEFLNPIFSTASFKLRQIEHGSLWTEYLLMITSSSIAIGAIFLARNFYLNKIDFVNSISLKFKKSYNILLNKYFVDEAYEATIIKPISRVSDKFLYQIIDVKVIDNFLNFSAKFIDWLSSVLVKIQSGVVQDYAVVFVFGIVILFGILFVV